MPFGTSLHQHDYVSDGIPVINPKNIVNGIVTQDGIKRVSSETIQRLREFMVRANDVIIGRRGEMGRCAIITEEMDGWLCGTGCFVIRLKSQYDSRFAFFQLTSPKVKAYLEASHYTQLKKFQLNQKLDKNSKLLVFKGFSDLCIRR